MDNTLARRVFLHAHGLGAQPTGPGKGADLLALIEQLGFVQVDSVRTVERAHDMIVFARRPAYRPGNLKPLLERDRSLFEHWTHDASIVPTAQWPHWRLRFERDRDRLKARYKASQGGTVLQRAEQVLDDIRVRGSVCSRSLAPNEARKSGGWWDWNPSKTALDYLWRCGDLSICHRTGFEKHFDLTDRVIPDSVRQRDPSAAESIDWLCGAALDRLGFATSGELAAFWDIVTPADSKDWVARHLASGAIEPVSVQTATGETRASFARRGWLERAKALADPPGRLRVLSPFDPMLRDRKRAERLFGFSYRIEIFVPAAKRRFGYYVFPLLEGAQMVGRIDMARDGDALVVRALWPERGVNWGRGRQERLEAELSRVARFAGLADICFSDGWMREPV